MIGNVDLETLSKALHEAGREAVEKGATVAADKFGEQSRIFLGWNAISESAREGRRIQARYLLERFFIFPKDSNLSGPALEPASSQGQMWKHFCDHCNRELNKCMLVERSNL